MAFSKSVLCVVVLALFAAAVAGQSCSITRQAQTANLANVSPKGCLKEVVNATGDIVKPECFNKLKMNMTNGTGTGCPPGTFTISFVDQENCAPGMEEIANGTLSAPSKSGVSTVTGKFITETPFKGTSDSKGNFVVAAEGTKCELTYAVKPVGKPVTLSAAETTAVAKAAPAAEGKAADAKAADSKAPASDSKAPEPAKKSAASSASASIVLALLCIVLALVL